MKVLPAHPPVAGENPQFPRPENARLLSGGLLCLPLLLAACQDKGPATAVASPPIVDVAAALSGKVTPWGEFNGRIGAMESVEIRPRISGYIQSIAFKEGQEMRRGALLFVIDPRPYRTAFNSADARLDRARATSLLARAQDERAQTLLQTNATSIEDAETRHANYVQSVADVHDAEAAVAMAKLNLEFTEVRAPISGRVSRAMLTVGNLAVADQTLLTSIVSQDPVYVYFDPDEHSFLAYSAQAQRSQGGAAAPKVRVGLANENNFPHLGRVEFIDNNVNPTTGTIQARATLSNADRAFTPGLYARVQYAGGSEIQAILIKDKSVLTDQDRKYVYVLDSGNKAQRKEIELGGMSDGLRVVKKGLVAGDKVIIEGMQRIFFSGAPVTPTEVPMSASTPNAIGDGTIVAAVAK
ncbi:efflux RND transporter periplasmic adaptor subunit [Undibacterium sp. TJN25]|uniref:efflux RND transporter periplasmic adaptor subunit n=1 Tax=Undibacterium sp. TJN25 TaxID=3413056 RepID=UPI003BF30DF3